MLNETVAESVTETTEFNWKNCWYPVVFIKDLPKGKPYPFTLYNEPLVLFDDGKGKLMCAQDRCPHRAARLSEGQIIDGKLECLYHGWQFNVAGECVRIPQLAQDKHIPPKACLKPYPLVVRQELVWVWAGDPALANPETIPSIAGMDKPNVISIDYIIDLPYDQTYLIENVIDVAHIHVAHHGLRGGGHRDYALPLDFEVLESSVQGIKATYRSIGLETNRDLTKINRANLDFVAPNLIHYTSGYANKDLIAGLALYSLPLGKGRCRLLYRKYSNFYSWRETAKPRWLDHWNQNTILKQDMSLIIGQYSEIERSGQNIKDLWLPIKTSDTLVLQYRKWLDSFAQSAPFYRGYNSFKSVTVHDETPPAQDIYNIHTKHCSSCLLTYRATKTVQKIVVGLAVLTLPVLFLTGSPAWAYAYFACCGLGLLAGKMKRQFE